jgi:hypothetical protein
LLFFLFIEYQRIRIIEISINAWTKKFFKENDIYYYYYSFSFSFKLCIIQESWPVQRTGKYDTFIAEYSIIQRKTFSIEKHWLSFSWVSSPLPLFEIYLILCSPRCHSGSNDTSFKYISSPGAESIKSHTHRHTQTDTQTHRRTFSVVWPLVTFRENFSTSSHTGLKAVSGPATNRLANKQNLNHFNIDL